MISMNASASSMCRERVPSWLMVRGSLGQNLKPFCISAAQIRIVFLRRNGVKGGVAFNGGQPLGIFAQEVGRFGSLWVKISHPGFERPDRATEIESHKRII